MFIILYETPCRVLEVLKHDTKVTVARAKETVQVDRRSGLRSLSVVLI